MHRQFFRTDNQVPPEGHAMIETFREFDATELYCPKCGRAVPVRKRLLLILPEGEEYEYLCSVCGTSVGTKLVRGTEQVQIII